jgi:DNA-binding LytR/AlgR family response regulator
MRVLLIEDEKPAARRLERMLNDFDIGNIDMVHSVEEAVNYFTSHAAPDLMFLDIQLSDGLSFEIFEHVQVSAPIIFTTAFDEYALRAFKLNSIDYLLKPIDREELEAAMDKFNTKYKPQGDLKLALSQMREEIMGASKNKFKERWMIRLGQQIKLIKTSDICLFYAEDKVNYLQTFEPRTYDVDQSLEDLEQLLDPEIYFRMNRSSIIHIEGIAQILSYSNSRLQVKAKCDPKRELIVSRDRVKAFKMWLEHGV